MSDSIYLRNWEETMKYANALQDEGAYDRDSEKWPLETTSGGGWWWDPQTTTVFKPQEEIQKMSTWLRNRKDYLDGIIAGYPDGDDEVISTDFTVVGTISKTQDISFSRGYSQSSKISINQNEVSAILGGAPTDLVPLNADGTEGNNTAAGTYGAWFDENGNTAPWAQGHVYIESNSLYSWSFGCHPDNCWYDEIHTVTMQYRLKNKAVNVVVTFNVK